jgi:hypothetical protein
MAIQQMISPLGSVFCLLGNAGEILFIMAFPAMLAFNGKSKRYLLLMKQTFVLSHSSLWIDSVETYCNSFLKDFYSFN